MTDSENKTMRAAYAAGFDGAEAEAIELRKRVLILLDALRMIERRSRRKMSGQWETHLSANEMQQIQSVIRAEVAR